MSTHTFLLNGEEHLERRRVILPVFHGKRVDAYEHIVEEEVMNETANWPEGREFETLETMGRLTLNSILRAVFGDACPPFSGSKGMLGHTLGAAGVVETILCMIAMRENFVPGTPRLSVPADCLPASVVREPRSVSRLNHVLKLNTGFGGVNGALILGNG